MAKIAGKNARVILEADAVAELVSWSLSIARDKVDATSCEEDWKNFVVATAGWTGGCVGHYDGDNIQAFFDAVSGTAVKKLYLYPDATDLTKYFYGEAWVNVDMDVSRDAVVDFTAAFQGDDQLKLKL